MFIENRLKWDPAPFGGAGTELEIFNLNRVPAPPNGALSLTVPYL